MSTTYHFEIVSLATKTIGDVEGIVKKIEYAMIGTHESGYTADQFGMIELDDPADPTTVTAYSELTEEQVQGWVSALIPDDEEAAMKANIDKMIEDATTINDIQPLPWAPVEEVPGSEDTEVSYSDEDMAAMQDALNEVEEAIAKGDVEETLDDPAGPGS